MTKTIIVDISNTGEILIEADGFTGKACEEATKELIAALGATDQKITLKPEHRQREVKQTQKVSRG